MLKILVPVDFTQSSLKASQYALSLATAAPQAQLLLLHCFQDYLADADGDLPPPLEMTASEEITERVMNRNVEEAEDQLEEIYQQLRTEATTRNIHTHVERAFINGLPEDVIMEEVKRFKPDLVVMGTKGESDITRSLFGTVTTKVVQNLNIPVLTVPGTYTGTRPNKVAYASNFESTDSKEILQLQQLLQFVDPELYCVHVSKTRNGEKDNQHLASLKHELAQNSSGKSISYILLEGDNVAKALQNFVYEQQINLLALTTHKRSGLSNFLSPSLTQKLVLEAEVPLLILHTPEDGV